MYLQSLRHAAPSYRYTQAECWHALEASSMLDRLRPRSRSLLERILLAENGIETRRFAASDLSALFQLDGGELNARFEREAPALAGDALRLALADAGMAANQLDALFVCTCTGYLCPGVSSYVAEQIGLDPRVYLQDIVGLGCGAAIPTLRSAQGFLRTQPGARIACIAVEVCSAAFFLDDDPGVLVSASLFGDAASASIWSGRTSGEDYRIDHFDTLHLPEKREALRFTNQGGKLRNQLHRSVPEIAADAVDRLYDRFTGETSHSIAAHVGGRDVLEAIERKLHIPRLEASWDTLRNYGNTSSPSVLIAAEQMLHEAPPQLWLTSFGAGFAAHSCALTRES